MILNNNSNRYHGKQVAPSSFHLDTSYDYKHS